MLIAAVAFGAYALGCLTAGYYVVRLRTRQDIRDLGSGNVGARNAGRVLGPTGFALVLALDFAKGALAVWATRQVTANEQVAAVALPAVVAGHIWPLQLGLRGGKGVAPSLGALVIYDPAVAALFAGVFLGALTLLRRVVLAGLVAYLSLPVGGLLLARGSHDVIALSILAVLVQWAHRRDLGEQFTALRRHPDSSRADQTGP